MKVLFFIISVLSCFILITGQVKIKSYDYPVKPGTDKWKSFNTHKEMVDACQIPENILISMTNDELLENCLEYPMFFDIWAFNSLQEGFEAMKSKFNGLQELFKRDKIYRTLIKKYKTLNPKFDTKNKNLLEIGTYTLEFTKLEIILSQKEILNQIPDTEKKELISLIYSKFNEKKSLSEFYRGATLEPICYLLFKMVEPAINRSKFAEQNNDKNIESFYYTGSRATIGTITFIDSLVKSYLVK